MATSAPRKEAEQPFSAGKVKIGSIKNWEQLKSWGNQYFMQMIRSIPRKRNNLYFRDTKLNIANTYDFNYFGAIDFT